LSFRRFTAVAQKSPHGEISSAADQLARVANDTNLYQALSKTYRGVPFSLCNIFVFPMLSRTRLPSSGFIEPCLPSPADRPPSGPDWIHEIKHDGYRLMARRDPDGTRLLTRNGHDWSPRYPIIVEAVDRLKVRSRLIDGEAVACDKNGLAVFERLRRKPTGKHVFLYAFDLLELDGQDLRREPLETRKATLARLLRASLPGLRLNEHLAHDGESVFRHACKMGLEGIVSKRLGLALPLWPVEGLAEVQEPGSAWR